MKKSNFVKFLTILLMACGGIGLVGGGFFLSRALDKSEETTIVKDSSKYSEIRYKVWLNPTLVNHFPESIPKDATNVRLVYVPASAQGGSAFQVKFKQPQEKIKSAIAKYNQVAKYKYKGGDTNDHSNQANGIPTTFFYTSDDADNGTFPPDYNVLVLGAEDKGQKEFKWNHGNSYGVAISRLDSTIVYWVEAW
ncbi:hypothetical protein [Brunnivagina elsteri]|uniref:Uncharacterized protein n=1 Tax=Brunnivagina elsteri CCALA 953 TaxID=987040 RepID=A0A2A2TN55_9CYAN|nr:hypothetical protein [Calothrix elsteri]PAX59855.1 hypothetical protein CK510_04955 [Calothrix elsteri CCALA 953]